jgi:hypothetical protein
MILSQIKYLQYQSAFIMYFHECKHCKMHLEVVPGKNNKRRSQLLMQRVLGNMPSLADKWNPCIFGAKIIGFTIYKKTQDNVIQCEVRRYVIERNYSVKLGYYRVCWAQPARLSEKLLMLWQVARSDHC